MSVKQAEELQSNITEEYFAKKMFEATLIFFGCIFSKLFVLNHARIYFMNFSMLLLH
jgi:hypothetical protein